MPWLTVLVRMERTGNSGLEFGGSDIGPLVQMPAALSYPMNMPRYDWGYVAEPEEDLAADGLSAPEARSLAGPPQ